MNLAKKPHKAGNSSRSVILPGVMRLEVSAQPAVPVLIAAPHGGRHYPDDVKDNFRDFEARLRLEDRYVDTLAKEIAAMTGAPLVVAETPRAVIDLNRSPDDVDWSMIVGGGSGNVRHSVRNRRARNGLGLVPRRVSGFGELWKHPLAHVELDRRIETIHASYHRALGEALADIRDSWGAVLLLDLHSMPPLRPSGPHATAPEFVIGDSFGASCDARLSACALKYFNDHGRPVAHNRPYAGGYILDRHAQPRRGIHAIQLEVCRSSYLDSRLDQPSPRLPAIARLIGGLIRGMAHQLAQIHGEIDGRQAAQ